ncbi:putative uncharacterized protein DDB_G0282133 [Sitodiplosis mosellana]|uniref:putative uncharacterized protein DDB_G0282133 n=1 Tax=Sitodiplosis mosellana TaxID=263140 RepID=UPI002444C126|nr:putative uncharacterized protein DDB_G0282133 [Sitodiplosis mosellana]
MPFFKRSAKVPITSCQQNENDNSETCAIDTYRLRSGDQPLDIANQNRLIEHESNAERLTTGSTSSSSVSERVSSFVNGIIGKMGKNRRKNKLSQQPIQQQQQQQQQQQSHLKKVHLQSDKQPQHGKIQRQPTVKKGQHNEFHSNETTAEHNKSVPVSFDVNIKSEHGLKGDGGGGYDEKLQRKLHDTKNNMKNQQNAKILHSKTFNTNENERVIDYNNIVGLKSNQMKSGSTNASDCQANNRNQPIDAVANNENDQILCPLNERVIKNSPFAEETQPLHSCIEIDSFIGSDGGGGGGDDNDNDVNDNDDDEGKNNLNRSECKQLTPQTNNHISSRSDANNNEVNNAVKNIGDVQKTNVTVNCETDSKRIPSAEQQQKQQQQQQQQDRSRQLENSSSIFSTNHIHKTERSKNQQQQPQQPVPCYNKTTSMGQSPSTNTINKSKQQNNANHTKSTNYGKTAETKVCADQKAAATANICHDAAAKATARAAEAPHYDKNKINFSNEINEILESETSSKQSGAEPEPKPKPEPEPKHSGTTAATTTTTTTTAETANEIKDVFYETSSDLNGEINSTVFVTNDGKSVTTTQYTRPVTENVNGSSKVTRFESVSNGINNINHKTDTKIPKIPLKNDKIDVTIRDTVEATATVTISTASSAVPSSENDSSERCCVTNDDVDQCEKSSVSASEKIQIQRDCTGAGVSKPKLSENCENSAQMEQNVLYRVDSYNSDDALELSDIEETVIDQHGKVIEVKTLFKQRPTGKLQSIPEFRKNSTDHKIDGIRTINGRRRSNSITGSLGIEIVEVGLSTNNTQSDYLTQQPFVSFADDSTAIKLSDLRDNTKEAENVSSQAIDIVEIVEESESGSEYEEIEEEIEEEEIEEEIEEIEEEEEEEEEEELVSADGSLSNDSVTENNANQNTANAFKSNQNSSSVNVNGSQKSVQHTKPNRLNNDSNNNDVIHVSIDGQPQRFNANKPINLSQAINKNTEPLSHSHSRVNEHELMKKTPSQQQPHSDNNKSTRKIVNDNISSVKGSSNAYDKSSESMLLQQKQQKQQYPPKYSDDAMHLPDIVVGSTLLSANHGSKKPIPLSRSPPKIVVNDNTLDSWSSNEEETGTISDSFDESLEVDDETADLTDDEEAEKSPNEKLLYPGVLNIGNKNESNESQNNVHNEAKQHELNLLAQLNEAKTNVAECQQKIADLTYKISELERDLTVKSWNVERLQAELEAAYKELHCVKDKLKHQEDEIDKNRAKYSEQEDDFNIKINNLQSDHIELKQKLDQMQSLAISLQVQLSSAQNDLADLRAEKEKLIGERDVERQALQDALDAAIIERAENDAKWQRDFEQLRTLNSDREELLLQDCEWKIRSTERACKERINAAEQAKKEAIKTSEKLAVDTKAKQDQMKHLKTTEAELAALRGLSNEQRYSIAYLTQQLEEIKERLDEATSQLEEANDKIHRMAVRFASDLSDKDREMIAKIDEVRYEVASMWEDRILNEMIRLKDELEICFAEERMEAVQKAQKEHIDDVNQLKESFAFREKILQDEIEAIKEKLVDRNRRLDEANEKADKQIMQIRMILNKSEQGHQREFNKLRSEFEEREAELKAQFEAKIDEIKKKSSDELSTTKSEMIAKLKRDYELNYEKFKADKEEEQIDMQRNYKRKLSDADVKMRDIEILHQREIKDLQNAHSMERSSLEQRDLQNSQEIETLHRKCRCLTQLFDEMRIRYERREPRAEDIRTIEELKSIIEAQDKDLRLLTEELRKMQMRQNGGKTYDQLNYDQNEMMQDMQPVAPQSPTHSRKMKKPILNCDVIYEAEEEDESQPISA